MALLQRVTEDEGARAAARVVAERDASVSKKQQDEALSEIITEKLRRIAAEMEEELTPMTQESHKFPKHFALGGVVILVEMFESLSKDPDPSRPHLVINDFYVSLVAIDSNDYCFTVRVGMLSMFNYEALYRTITEERSANFDAIAVLKKLDF